MDIKWEDNIVQASFDELYNAILRGSGVYISGWSRDLMQNSKKTIARKQFIQRSDIELYGGLTERYNVYTNKYEKMPRRISFRGVEIPQLFVPLEGSIFPTGGGVVVSFEKKTEILLHNRVMGHFGLFKL